MKKSADTVATLILGSAMWGWTVSAAVVFDLLDEWYQAGFREVDAATNYPIDKNPDHFRRSEQILQEWIKANGVNDLRVMMKVGSVNNLFTPEHLLTRSFMQMMLDEYRHLFGGNLDTFMIHWDNRSEAAAIRESLDVLKEAHASGLSVGLSGIKFPETYAALNSEYQLPFRIQIKHNVFYSDHNRYASFHGQRRFIGYGINGGGIKLDAAQYSDNSTWKARGGIPGKEPDRVEEVQHLIKQQSGHPDRPTIDSFYQIGLIHAYYHPEIAGILIGASNKKQLKESIHFFQSLKELDYTDIYQGLID